MRGCKAALAGVALSLASVPPGLIAPRPGLLGRPLESLAPRPRQMTVAVSVALSEGVRGLRAAKGGPNRCGGLGPPNAPLSGAQTRSVKDEPSGAANYLSTAALLDALPRCGKPADNVEKTNMCSKNR